MYKKGTQLRNILFESFQERNESFFYLAPDIIGSVATANMDMDKNLFIIDFNTTDGRDLKLSVDNECVNNWMDKEENSNSGLVDFIKHFLQTSTPEEEFEQNKEEVEPIEEIVDEYGDIMSDDDESAINPGIGKSKFDSDRVVKQVIPRTRRYYNDNSLGVITW
jgi:hypothetical protein